MADRADEILPGLSQELAAELARLMVEWPVDLPFGVIHADLFPDNVFFVEDPHPNPLPEGEGKAPSPSGRGQGEGIRLSGLIDFYFACNDFYVYDLAICLNAWCFETNHEFNITRAQLLLKGYHAVRPISEAELDALPALARGSALRFLLTRAHDWLFPVPGALVKPKDPMEYVKKLRFHQKVRHHSEYGL